ncbi:hypothetical protein ACLQ3C_19600 [Gordonia sp. DT30]|uniref:hypothetical protein n=1 Tax=unclassified Gordonia (in: high G+C Gram-positive bacteria) TaxID=2657482 RepID=UPI003CED9DF8
MTRFGVTWTQRNRVRPLVRPHRVSRRFSRRGRRAMAGAAVLIVAALVVAAIAWTQAHRQTPRPTDAERSAVERAATSAITALMTFGGEHAPSPATVRTHLSDPLLARYDADRADVVLPGALAASARMTVTVIGVAVGEFHPDRARVLAFGDQSVTVPDPAAPDPAGAGAASGNAEHTPYEKWLVMSKVNGTWLLADMQQVGDVTR